MLFEFGPLRKNGPGLRTEKASHNLVVPYSTPGEVSMTDARKLDSEPPMNCSSSEPKTVSPSAKRNLSYQLGRFLGRSRLLRYSGLGLIALMLVWIFITGLYHVSILVFGDQIALLVCVAVFVVGCVSPLLWSIVTCQEKTCAVKQLEDAATVPPSKQTTSGWNWTTWLVAGAIYSIAMHQMNSDQTARTALTHRQSAQSNQAAQEKARRQQACLSYWQAAVADLHSLRFETPSGDEPSGAYRDRITGQLWKLTERAKGASKANVDADLVTMAHRHLGIDDRLMAFKETVDQLMKREGMEKDSVGIGERIDNWQQMLTMLQSDPSLLDKLPAEYRSLMVEAMELEQLQVDRFHEIEIMQAVLKERYPGATFSLPAIAE